MVDKLLHMALLGGEPILYVLIALSGLSIVVVLERAVHYAKKRTNTALFTSKLVPLLNQQKIDAAVDLAKSCRGSEAAVALAGLQNFDKRKSVVEELMNAAELAEQQQLDKRLNILGTIGSNAPFIGLLGTVLGIIKAFNDLAFNAEGGASVVMAGIAEALVATAIGLLVAIPAVVFFNYFKNKQKQIMTNASRLENTILAFVSEKKITALSKKAA
ncbi:MAG: MotA/TolQ/ExbB proton channel family protein [Deltaproteobacteria bacterium]|nr:MotA/TolQ/ExbB proton channel family protein [Deltaproteobacteria bacterium]MBN2670709.1 MotA/TolQ/ExbB proton channel family protein [Deltaproteobacteria bacterium]